MTGNSSTAIALFKMQNVDVFRGHISINHCMQILPAEKSFPCKSLLTALIELAPVTEGMSNADGLLIAPSREKINKRQQECLVRPGHKVRGGAEGGGQWYLYFLKSLSITADKKKKKEQQNLAALFHNHQQACGGRSAWMMYADMDRRPC